MQEPLTLKPKTMYSQKIAAMAMLPLQVNATCLHMKRPYIRVLFVNSTPFHVAAAPTCGILEPHAYQFEF